MKRKPIPETGSFKNRKNLDYSRKFESIKGQTLFASLDKADQFAIRKIALDYRFTLQELKIFVESAVDLTTWGEDALVTSWSRWQRMSNQQGREFKKFAFKKLHALWKEITEREISYEGIQIGKTPARTQSVVTLSSEDRIFGTCPVYSEKTLCCNLYTIDAVKNCGFGCTYCSIQSLYGDSNVIFDENLGEKLDSIKLDRGKYYHIGTGQSSDSLMWGNTHGILDNLFSFARKWPNTMIEFKTKSKNVDYLLKAEVPGNIVCSWSLNPDNVIKNEEHLTPCLGDRMDAARKVADRGIRVGFHLHPMVLYQGWRDDYTDLIENLMRQFHMDEVVFISFGSLTFPKPVLQGIRSSGRKSKIYQMPLVPNPEGKMTCPDNVKIQLFRHAYAAFTPWHKEVFFYLCMEGKKTWESIFGMAYKDNRSFEECLLESARKKLNLTVDSGLDRQSFPDMQT